MTTAFALRIAAGSLTIAFFAPTAIEARSPDDPDIAAAVRRGRSALGRSGARAGATGREALAALALVKTGSSPSDPGVAGVLAAVDAATADGLYAPPKHHTYTAGIVMMLLQAAGRERDDPALRAVLQYLLAGQRPYGGWYYPSGSGQGDTSITQYAALGLWSAEEAGLDVPVAVWDRLAGWQSRTAVPGGGFAYHPPSREARMTMTLAGIGTLALCGRYLGVAAGREPGEEKPARKRFGLLEAVDEDATRDEAERERRDVKRTTSTSAIRGASRDAIAAAQRAPRFPVNNWPYYELYALERAVALSGPGRWNRSDWYEQGVSFLLPKQGESGLWSGRGSGDNDATIATSFAILFLSKSTHKALGVGRPSGPPLGDGLLAGGRGLPGDLAAVSVKGGRVETRELTAPLDRLLADLEAAPAERVTAGGTDALQRELVAAVRGGTRDELIGRLDALAGLARNRDPAVRRVAAWALGRSGGEEAAVLLVRLLRGDADFSVQREAHAALLFLSRRAAGGDVREPAGADDRVRWREDAVAEWTEWLKSAGPSGSSRGLRPVDDPLFSPAREDVTAN